MAVDAEMREQMARLLLLTEENNKYLHKLYRAHMWRTIWSVSYWVVIIGVTFGAYYFLQPYLDQFGSVYGTLKSQVERIQGVEEQLKGAASQLPGMQAIGLPKK
jgi:hypothetical protein